MRLPAPQDPVALGMRAYVRARFRVRVFGLEHLRIEPGQIFAPSHRSDNDVPLLISVLYPTWSKAIGHGASWPTFGAMIELFLPGFFAGYPGRLPLALRRALWPYQPGDVLNRHLQCVPVREPNRMRLQELLRHAARTPLDELLPGEVLEALSARAAVLGAHRPVHAGDVLRGAYADLLWTYVERDSAPDPDEAWRAHGRAAVQDFRRLAQSLASGGSVVLFPEGGLSTDGEIGQLQPGLASLARRGNAHRVQPVALTYDPLVGGRTLAGTDRAGTGTAPTGRRGGAADDHAAHRGTARRHLGARGGRAGRGAPSRRGGNRSRPRGGPPGGAGPARPWTRADADRGARAGAPARSERPADPAPGPRARERPT